MASSLRFLPFAVADGPTNMAADEAMLRAAAEGVASLRFYAWSPPTLSLGYFQAAAVRFSDENFARLPWLRRATGGATLIHDQELTYALALPAGLPWQTGQPWMRRFHDIIRLALAPLNVAVDLAVKDDARGDVLCFEKQTVGDLLCHGHKIGGSAQRKHRRSLLQHGSIVLRRSPFTPTLPGIFELTGIDVIPSVLIESIDSQLAAATGWTFEPSVWSAAELRLIERLSREKFGDASWNDKR